jgi:PhnB protein
MAILLGHLAADLAIPAGLMVPIVALALALGVRSRSGPLGVLLFLVLGCAWSLAFAALGYAIPPCGPLRSRWHVLAQYAVTMTDDRFSTPAVEQRASISVMLIVPDASDAIAWYRRALGARELWNLGGVAGLEIGGAPFFLHEVNPENPGETSPLDAGRTSTRVELLVEDPEEYLNGALSAGATLGSPITEHQHAWGRHRQGGFRDPFGHNWSVGDKSPIGQA